MTLVTTLFALVSPRRREIPFIHNVSEIAGHFNGRLYVIRAQFDNAGANNNKLRGRKLFRYSIIF